MQHFLAVDSLITFIISILFGVIVLYKNKKSKLHQILFLFNTTVGLWAFGYWQWLLIYDDRGLAIFWLKFLTMSASWIPVFYFHWIIYFLEKSKAYQKIIYIVYFVGFIFSAFSFSDLLVYDVKPALGFSFWPVAGPLYVYYILIYLISSVFAVSLLAKSYLEFSGQKRLQSRYIFWGYVLASLGGATNFFLWYDIPIKPYGNILVVLYPILFSYAIIRYRLMDIKLVMRRWSVFLASFLSVIIISFFIKIALINLLVNYPSWVNITVLSIAIFVFPPLQKYYFELSNKYLFSSLYDSKKVIAELSERLRSMLEVKKVYGLISEILTNSFHSKSIGVMLYHNKSRSYAMQYSDGFSAKILKNVKSDQEIQDVYFSANKIIILEELKNLSDGRYNKFIDAMTDLNIAIIAPLNIKNRTLGLLILGHKEAGDMYNDEDIQVLKIVSAQMAIALENGLLYEETKNFNQKLKREIEIATADLRSANEKLTKLDAAKSEFISIASHQLRTPLTAIKGYISMMLEGDFGELNIAEKESLEKVFDSNERLIKLVENLLNVSRIESGRLQFNFEQIQLETMVSSVMDELSGYAKKRDLVLEYKKPENPLPKVNIDDEKIRQVVMNLIDNAIKYTKKGTISVSLMQNEKNIEFCVSDSGMGISPQDLPNLFQKFTRGTGTSLVHTEGTGLGLYVAKQMMEAHHGTIWAESKGEGLGSKFCFKLPIIQQIS